MKIDSYIVELLFDHECVIVPGLGGFIINDRHATIDHVTHQFNPPFKKILFNQHIRFNDGLLVNHIANRESLSFETVRKQIDELVLQYFARLENNEKIKFENIGVIAFNSNKNITFDQDNSVNFNAESFGLGSFVSPPIKRKVETELVKGIVQPQPVITKREDRKPERTIAEELKPIHKRRNKSNANVRTFILISLIAVLLTAVSLAYFNSETTGNYWQKLVATLTVKTEKSRYTPRSEQLNKAKNIVTNQAGFLSGSTFEIETPATKNISENIAEANPAESKYLSGEISVADNFNYRGRNLAENSSETVNETEIEEPGNNLVEEPVAEEPAPPVAKEELVVSIKPSSQYFIIAGSFSEESNALSLIDDLIKKGFPAQIIDTSKNGMYRVAYLGIGSFTDAKQKLYAIREDDNPEAWILKK